MKLSPRDIGRRALGRCEDCGWTRLVRVITFWATGYRYTVCADCERAYRGVINWPVVRSQEASCATK